MTFYKYHGAGNDFILFDNREGKISLSNERVAEMCHRRFGIGADGLMLLEHVDGFDFNMVYYNSDGRQSSMCGNGGRCIAAFAKQLGIVTDHANFMAIDGAHSAKFNADDTISVHMQDVDHVTINKEYTFLNTGSPHYVQFVEDVKNTAVFTEGRRIRNLAEFAPGGTNVNFVQIRDAQNIIVRTYERGVEDETLSCGTGVTAAAIAATCEVTGTFKTNIDTPGGQLEVSFTKNGPLSATDVILRGPAVFVFKGEI
jgi:diaminopimelate epimerase